MNFCYIIDNNEEQQRLMYNSIRSLRECYEKYNTEIYVIALDGADVKAEGAHIIPFDTRLCHILPLPTKAMNGSYLGYNALSRFLMPYILPCDEVYYADNDILFVRDIFGKLTDFDHDVLIRIWKNHLSRTYSVRDHINTGFFYCNCRLWRGTKEIFGEIYRYFLEHQDTIYYMNQDCYTWLITERYKDSCIVDDDININNRNMYDGVEVFHGFGKSKEYYQSQYEKYLGMTGYRGYSFTSFHGTMTDRQQKAVVDLLEERRPKRICEFGCGQSTLIFERYCEKYGGRLLSVEHDERYARKDTAILPQRYGTTTIGGRTYDKAGYYDGLDALLEKEEPFDFVCVDAPIWSKALGLEYSRIQAVEFVVKGKLSEEAVLAVHDTDRKGEQNTISELERLMTERGYVFQRTDTDGEERPCRLTVYVISASSQDRQTAPR